MMKIIKSLWRAWSALLYIFGIFLVPKDIMDWKDAAEPWKRAISMVDQNKFLMMTSILLAVYIIWMDIRPYYYNLIENKKSKSDSSKIPDIRASEKKAIIQLAQGPERDKLIVLLQSGDIKSWSRTKGIENLRPVNPALWNNCSLLFREIDGELCSLITPPRYDRVAPWSGEETKGSKLTDHYDVYFNKSQILKFWPDLKL